MRVSEALSAYRADREPVVVAIARIDQTIKRLLPGLGDVEINDLTRSVIASYAQRRMQEGVQGPTIRRELVTLRAALRMLAREGLISRVPVIPMPARSRPRSRCLSSDEMSRLLAASTHYARAEVLVRLLIATGARIGAICELTWDRVDLDGLQIDLRADHPRAGRRKGRAVVPISPSVADYLQRFRADEPNLRRRRCEVPPDRVIGLTVSGARLQLYEVARRAGVEGVSPHVIRHSVATHLLRSIPLPHVSKMLGHSSVAITADIYGHLNVQDLRGAAAALDAIQDGKPVTQQSSGLMHTLRRLMGWQL